MTKTIPPAMLIALAGCGSRSAEPQAPPMKVASIACSADSKPFARGCTVERTRQGDGWLLVIRHPDGHFRRFTVSADGVTINSADGSQALAVARDGGGVELIVGGDRYRLPVAR